MTRYRALDIHSHYRTGERRAGSESHADARKAFGADGVTADPIERYEQLGFAAVVFDVDNETTSGQRSSNDEIAELTARSDGRLIGFGSVDPWKGKAAVRELERCVERGLKGLKLQPITQAMPLEDPRFRPLWDACQSLGLPVMVHTGTTAIGAGSPGGRGLRLRYGRPVPGLDDVAADYPRLTLIAAHFAWPWHLELLAVARHKGNVYIDLSGWAPRYIPPEVVRYCNSVMPEKFLFGSDAPLFDPARWMREFEELELKPEVRSKVLYQNACAILGLDPAEFGDDAADGTAGTSPEAARAVD
jgi:predicted TIM-barrel fold metal-dependent hydrolase